MLTDRHINGMAYSLRGDKDTEIVVFFHGFPCSSREWTAVANALPEQKGFLLFDWLGYGQSSKPSDADYSVNAHAERFIELVSSLGLTRLIVVAHDLGGIVLMNLLYKQLRECLPFRIVAFSLSNCSVDHSLYRPTFLQKVSLVPVLGSLLARAARPRLFKNAVKAVWGPKHPEESYLDNLWHDYSADEGKLLTPKHLKYIPERALHGSTWTAAMAAFSGSALLLWGGDDRVSGMESLKKAQQFVPHSIVRVHRAGHFPHVECQKQFIQSLNAWLVRLDSNA